MARERDFLVRRTNAQGVVIVQGQFWLGDSPRSVRRDLCPLADAQRMPSGRKRPDHTVESYLMGLYQTKLAELKAEAERKPKSLCVSAVMQLWLDHVTQLRNPTTAVFYAESVNHYIAACGDHAVDDYQHANNIKLAIYLKTMPNLRGGGYSVASQRKHFRHLQAFFNWAHQAEYISRRIKLTGPQAQRRDLEVYSIAELAQLGQHILAKAKAEPHARRRRNKLNDHRAFILAVHTLLREGAIWSLRLDHIDLARRVIRIRHNPELGWTNKKGKEVDKPINDGLLPYLLADLAARPPQERYFLDDGHGQPGYKHPQELSRSFRRYRDELGLPPYKPFHGIRGAMITHLLNSGVDLKSAKELADHESITTTAGYASTRRLQVAQAAAHLDLGPITNQLPIKSN